VNDFIKVTYTVHSTAYFIHKKLKKLKKLPLLSFDTETRSVYTKKERKEAEQLLQDSNISLETKKLSSQVMNSSGLSFPSLVNVTHFIFGISESKSVILIAENIATEMIIWNWLTKYKGLIIVHNSLFDLKLMYHRTKKFPKQYKDTALLVKSFINNADIWKAKTGLKELMGTYYDPVWQLMDEYEPETLKDPKFLKYCSIDGASTFKLYKEIKQYIREFKTE